MARRSFIRMAREANIRKSFFCLLEKFLLPEPSSPHYQFREYFPQPLILLQTLQPAHRSAGINRHISVRRVDKRPCSRYLCRDSTRGQHNILHNYDKNIIGRPRNGVCHLYSPLPDKNLRIPVPKKNTVILSVLCSVAVLTKISIAALILPWLGVSAVVSILDQSPKKQPGIFVPFLVTLLISALYILRNILITGHPFSSLTALSGKYFIQKDALCYFWNYPKLLPNTALPLVLLGFAGLFKKAEKL